MGANGTSWAARLNPFSPVPTRYDDCEGCGREVTIAALIATLGLRTLPEAPRAMAETLYGHLPLALCAECMLALYAHVVEATAA